MARIRNRTFDTLLTMKDAGLVAATAAATVGGSASAAIIDTMNGSSQGWNTGLDGVPEIRGDLVIDWSACEVATGDERYDIVLQASSSSTFASDIVELAVVILGAADLPTGHTRAATASSGRHIVPWVNRVGTTNYRYLRIKTVVAGTVATGINFTAQLAMEENNLC